MKIENQVCSLELAKELKELGVKQESLWYWVHNKVQDTYKVRIGLAECFKKHPESWEYYSAFTVAELGELLPNEYCSFKDDKYICAEINGDLEEWWNDYAVNCRNHTEEADTEANARAKMLVYLLENNLTKAIKGE